MNYYFSIKLVIVLVVMIVEDEFYFRVPQNFVHKSTLFLS